MPGEVWLIRHAETDWAKAGKHTGRTDVPLNDEGREHAASLPARLAELSPSLVLTSPLSRAKETAAIAGFGDAAIEDPDLLEYDYGDYEGLTTAEIRESRPDWFLFTDGVVPGPPEHPGESVEEVGERADRVLARVDAAFANTEGCVVLVAHGHFLRVLTARRLGLRHPMQLSGLYEGIPLNLRSVEQSGTLPERITLYRRPIIAEWQSARFSLEQLVSHIVIHEVGHHFGFSDDEMHALEDEAE